MTAINEIANATSVATQPLPTDPSNRTQTVPAATGERPGATFGSIQDTVEVSATAVDAADLQTASAGRDSTDSNASPTQAAADPDGPSPDQASGPSSDALQPGSGTRDDPVATNQRTSNETERTGNDGGRSGEATRTLGQVVDIFA